MDGNYVQRLMLMGFEREKAEMVAAGKDVVALPKKEFLTVAHCYENDKVEPLKPLVKKYGWEELVERIAASDAVTNE